MKPVLFKTSPPLVRDWMDWRDCVGERGDTRACVRLVLSRLEPFQFTEEQLLNMDTAMFGALLEGVARRMEEDRERYRDSLDPLKKWREVLEPDG